MKIKNTILKRNTKYIKEFGVKLMYDEISKQQYINFNLIWYTVSFFFHRKPTNKD